MDAAFAHWRPQGRPAFHVTDTRWPRENLIKAGHSGANNRAIIAGCNNALHYPNILSTTACSNKRPEMHRQKPDSNMRVNFPPLEKSTFVFFPFFYSAAHRYIHSY